jgi:hypothetical protein
MAPGGGDIGVEKETRTRSWPAPDNEQGRAGLQPLDHIVAAGLAIGGLRRFRALGLRTSEVQDRCAFSGGLPRVAPVK